MTFAETVKNREWEKVFDILDQGMDCTPRSSSENGPVSCPIFVFQGSIDVSIGPIRKDKLGVMTKEEFEESLKQNGFEASGLDTERKRSIFRSWLPQSIMEFPGHPGIPPGIPGQLWAARLNNES